MYTEEEVEQMIDNDIQPYYKKRFNEELSY